MQREGKHRNRGRTFPRNQRQTCNGRIAELTGSGHNVYTPVYMYCVSMATGPSLTTFIPLLYNVLLITLTLCFDIPTVNQIPGDSMPCL